MSENQQSFVNGILDFFLCGEARDVVRSARLAPGAESDFYSTCKTIMKDFLGRQDQITEGFGEGQCVLGCLPEVSLSAWHKPVSLGNFFSFSFALEMHN